MTDTKYLTLPNTAGDQLLLKLKTGPATGPRLDPGLLAQADRSFEVAKVKCIRDIILDVEEAKVLFHRANKDNSDKWVQHLTPILTILDNIADAASSLDFPLIEHIAVSLKRFINHRTARNDRAIEEIGLHIGAIERILREDLKGDGGASGRELIDLCRLWSERALSPATVR